MPNSTEKKSKSKNSVAVVSLLSENILESSSDDENEEEESQSSEVSVSKSKTSIFGKGWNAFKQLFNGVPNVMNPEKAVEGNDDSIDTESYEGITATETMEESEGTQSEPEQIEDLVDPQKDEDIEEYAVNACGWNRDEIIDCSKGNPLIMEDDMATGMPFESMPPGLRIRVIGTTIDYILFEEKKGVGFITQEVIEELFQKFTGVSLNDACQTIDMTFKDFVDLHFSAAFKNCHPHGLARLEVVDKPLQSAFDNFCSQAPPVAVTAAPTIKAIEHSSVHPPASSSSASSTQNVHSSVTVSQSTSSSSPLIQEEQISNIQSPSNSSSQSYTTPVESDAELYSVETAHHDVVEDEHEMLSTPVASAVPSRASLVEIKTETDENIFDLEDDVLDYVTETAKEQKKKEAEPKNKEEEPKNKEEVQPQKEVKPKAEEVKGGAKLKDGQHVNVLSPSLLFGKSDDEEDDKTTPIKAESKPDKFLQPTLLESESDDEEKQPTGKQPMSVKKENQIPAKVVSSNAKEVADKKLNVKKDVKQKEVSSAEKKQLDYDLLDVSSEDESDVEPPKMDKNAAKKSQPPSTVDESLKKPITSSQNSTLLSKSLLSSTDSSSDDERVEEEPPKIDVKEEKKSTTAPVKKNVEVKSSKNIANTSRLLESEILCDSEEEEKIDRGTKKKKPTQAKSDEKKSTKSGSKEETYIIDRNMLFDESDEDNKKDNNQKQEDKKSDASTLTPNLLQSGGSDESSDDEKQSNASSSNKKVKSKPIEHVKNIHLLDEKYMKPSDSESDSEQFVCIDPKEKEAKISADKKNEVFDIKNKPSLLSDSDEEGGENSAESDEVENSDVEGSSSLEASDIENDEPKHLEEDMFDILDKQIAEDFSKKSVENDAKAKEDEAKKTEEKLQNLAKKQTEYEKEGPTESGVYRLENYLNNFIIDSEPAKIEELPKPSEVKKSKSPVKVEQKPIIKEVEIPKNVGKEKSKSPASKENLSKVVEAKNEKAKPTAKVDPVKPKIAEAPKQPSKVSETKKESEKPKSLIGKYDPTIPVVGEDFLDQLICSEEVITVKKAAPLAEDNAIKPVASNPVPVIGDVFLDQNVKPVARNEVIMVEENFLEQVKTDENVAPKEDVPVLDVDNFLNEVSESSSKKDAPLLEDELLGSIDGNKSGVKEYENAKPVAQKEVQMVEEDFLNRIGEVASKRSDPVMIVDDFLDLVSDCQSSAKQAPVMASDDFLNQVSDNKSSTNKAVSDVSLGLLNQLYKINSEKPSNDTVSVVDEDIFLNQVSDNKAAATDYKSGYDKPVAQKEVKIVEEDFLNQIGDSNVASKDAISLLDGEDFLNQVSESKLSAKKAPVMASDDFLNQVSESKPSVKAAPIVDDDFLHHVSDNKSSAKKVPVIASDNFLNDVSESKTSNKNVPIMIDDNFLDEVSENKSSTKAAVPVIGDDFLDTLPDMKVTANKNVQLVGDDFLDSFDAKPSVPVVEEDFLEQIGGSNGITLAKDSYKPIDDKHVVKKDVKMVEEDFLNQIGDSSNVALKNAVHVLDSDDFLNQVSENHSANKVVPVVGEDFLNQVSESKSSAQKVPVMAIDDFLNEVSDSKPCAKKVPVMIDDNFLDEVSENKSSTKAAVPVIGDDFLASVSDNKPSSKNAVRVVGDELLDSFDSNKTPIPVVEEDFLAQVGGSNGIISGESATFSSSSTKPSMIVPGQKLFKPIISHKPSNANFFEDANITKLINAAEIGVNYDSDSSDSSTPEVSTRVFTFLEYKLDQYLNVPNYAVVHEMKDRIAKSTPPPGVNHLLNFWLENGFPFSDLVVFFQYLYYHVERLGCVDTLSFKTYEHLVDAVVRREHIFHSRHELVSNIPLMCQYKYLILDDNYPEYILINPELLKLQMYPLIGGLPTAVMYLFNVKRKWLISDLKEEFSDCRDAEFYRQLCNFLNDRPDLVMLQSPRPKATFPEMYIVLNDHISLKFCCYMFTLKDLNVAEKLHLRNDHIKSMKQFIPYR